MYTNLKDYRYEITGISAKDLSELGISFNQCQHEIQQLLKGRKIIGHGLENDFSVIKCKSELQKQYFIQLLQMNKKYKLQKRNEKQMEFQFKQSTDYFFDDEQQSFSKRKLKKLMNNKRRRNDFYFDTARCSLLNNDVRRPRSLKFLTELYLGIHIQGEVHDSVQDAIASIALYRAILPEILYFEKKNKMKIVQFREENENRARNEKILNAENLKKMKQEKYDHRWNRNYAYSSKIMNEIICDLSEQYGVKDGNRSGMEDENGKKDRNSYRNALFENVNDEDIDLQSFLNS